MGNTQVDAAVLCALKGVKNLTEVWIEVNGLHGHRQGVTRPQVSEHRIRSSLRRLRERGKVVHLGRGQYSRAADEVS